MHHELLSCVNRARFFLKNISKDMVIGDVRGNMFPAIEVFALAIGALMKSLMNHIKNQEVEIQDYEIKWVLTVPAIWNDKAKEFMRISAVKVFRMK